MSNTAEEGELCLYHGHSLGRFSNKSMRYDSHQACVRCVASAREGSTVVDIDRLLKRERRRALKFWSQVDIGQPDECWDWKDASTNELNNLNSHGGGMGSHLPRNTILKVLLCGLLGVTLDLLVLKQLAVNKYCCNPFHLIPQRVGVFVDQDSYLESFELALPTPHSQATGC